MFGQQAYSFPILSSGVCVPIQPPEFVRYTTGATAEKSNRGQRRVQQQSLGMGRLTYRGFPDAGS